MICTFSDTSKNRAQFSLTDDVNNMNTRFAVGSEKKNPLEMFTLHRHHLDDGVINLSFERPKHIVD